MLILLLFLSNAAKLYPKTSHPILLSKNNANSLSSYTFFYQISSYIPSDTVLQITFPATVYQSGLQLTTCKALNWDNTQLPCTVSSFTVSISIGELSNADPKNTYNITLLNIQNPSVGGSSMFRLQFIRGVNVLDYSDFFSDIGIVPAFSVISSASVTCQSNCVAGMASTYNIQFSTVQSYESLSKVFIQFPASLGLPLPVVCSSAQLVNISCSAAGNLISFVTTTPVSAGTSILIIFSGVQNPGVSGNVGDFSIVVYAPFVNTVVEQINQITGPTLSSNNIKSIFACPGGPSSFCIGYYPYTALANTQPYTLTFTTTNGVPLGGKITLTFISGFLLQANYCLIKTGLKNQGYTEDDQILCAVNPGSGLLTITKFQDFAGGSVSLEVIATNPSIPGNYSSFSVSTYSKTGTLIDTGTMGFIVIANIPHPMTWTVTWNKQLIVGSSVQMTVVFQPFTNSLFSNDVSFRINFPNTFSFSGPVKCYLTPHNVFPELVVSTTVSGFSIIIPSSTQSEPYTNSLNANNRLRLASSSNSDIITLPSLPGYYFVEMITTNKGVDIEALLYKMQVLPNIMPGSTKSFSYDVLKPALYQISFTPTITVPEGKVPELPQYSWGTIDVQFYTKNLNLQDLWSVDLGTGLNTLSIIPCKAIKNIKPVDGENLVCRLMRASTVSPYSFVTIRITNFQVIYQNVPVTIHLANITNPSTYDISVNLTVITYSITQRIYQEYNEVNFTFPQLFYLNTNPKLPKINGRSPAPFGDGLNEVKFTPNTVGLPAMSSFVLWTESDIQAGGNFYLKFPKEYPLLQAGISCFINYATQLPCYTYPDAGWISILNLANTMTNHVEYIFTIRYLKNPKHQVTPASASLVAISENVEIEYIYFSNFDYLDLGAVQPVNVYPDSYKANNVDTTYFWIFTLTNDLPVGSQIVLSFPKKDFNLDTSPAPYCLISAELQPVDSLAGIICLINGTSIVISGFQPYQGGTQVTVKVLNILNPPTSRQTDYFEIESYDSSGALVDGNYIISKIFIQSADSVGVFQYIDFYANPSNGLAIADYTVSVFPSRSLPVGSLIEIIFPQNEFKSVPKAVQCSLAGGLSTLSSCYGDGSNVVTVVTDSEYSRDSLSVPINITVYGISNFGPGLTSGLLEVKISNTGVVIDSSPNREDNRKVIMTKQPGPLVLNNIMFSTVTAGEKAVYNFSFTANTSFSESCQIVIKFPAGYARDLSEQVFCYSKEISKKGDDSIKCVVSGLNIYIYDTTGLDMINTTKFTISIQDVRNPSVNINSFFIFYSQCGYEMMDYGTQLFNQSFNTVPSPAYLTYAYSKGMTSLYPQEYVSFSSTSLSLITSQPGDMIFVEFPIDYDLTFIKPLMICYYIANNLSDFCQCSYEPNKVLLQPFQNNTLNGYNFSVAIQNIENPAEETEARFISLSFFQYSIGKVKVKTYSNLNRVFPFNYIKQGIQVIVNKLQSFNINVGTTFDNILVSIPSGAQTAFAIQGYISEPNCRITTNPIQFNLRDFSQYFSVSCNASAIIGDNYINWLFLGDWPGNYWSPIQRTYFSVLDTNQDLISVKDIGAVSLGGESLPILVYLTHSPEAFINITLTQVGTLPTGLTIFPEKLSFVSGQLNQTFRIKISPKSIGLSGKILIQKSGPSSQFFLLEKNLLIFDVGPVDPSYPVVIEYKNLVIGRTTARFSITLDKPCNVYWMVGRYGTRGPNLTEVILGSFINSTGLMDKPSFGFMFSYSQLTSNRFQYSINLTGLLAQTNYTLHIYSVDIGGKQATYTPKITFSTLDRYRSAQFVMEFNKSLSSQDVSNIFKKIASLLNIPSSMVVQRTDFSGSTGQPTQVNPAESSNYLSSSGISRALVNDSTLIGLILADPSLDLKPLDLVNSLNNFRNELMEIYGYLGNAVLKGQEVYGVIPVLRARPRIGSLVAGQLTLVNLALFDVGFISVCILEYNQSVYNSPIPYQVNNLLDTSNYKCNLSQVIKANPVPVQAVFYGIQKNLEYRVLISAYNALQGVPDYMWDVFVINFTTFGMAGDKAQSFSRRSILVSLIYLVI